MQTNSTIDWFEIPVTDLDRSAAFYGKVLQAELKREVLLGIPHAIFLKPSPQAPGVTGALMADPTRVPKQGQSTVIYLYVKDVAAALARATEHGGKVVTPTTPIAPFGTIAAFADLDGNVVGIHTPG